MMPGPEYLSNLVYSVYTVQRFWLQMDHSYNLQALQ